MAPDETVTRRTTMPLLPPAGVATAAAIAQFVLARGKRGAPASWIGAAALTGASAWLAGDAVTRFRVGGTTVNPVNFDGVTALVESGPYRLTRNPMYLAMAGLLTAHAVGRGSLRAMLPVAVFVTWMDRVQIPAEEAALQARFGTAYDALTRIVPRWLGPIGSN